MADSNSMYCFKTKKQTTLERASDKNDTQYPSDWFSKAGREDKPPVLVYTSGKTLLELATFVFKDFASSRVNIQLVCAFLYKYMDGQKAMLSEDWVSFNRMIGKEGDEVTPLSLITPTEKALVETNLETKSLPKGFEPRDLAMFCLLPYRLGRLADSFRGATWERLKFMFSAFPSELATSSVVIFGDKSFQTNRSYLGLVAAEDMFLYRFSDHPDSEFRVGTIPSRHRDCAALIAINHFLDFMGITSRGLFLDWIMTESCVDEIERMGRDNQELSFAYSYFPYHMDFGLARKSCYSSVVNPTIFFFINLACALLGSTRSQNARMTLETNVPAVSLNAMVAAFVFKNRVTLVKGYGGNADDEGEFTKPEETTTERTSELPDSLNGGDWFLYLKKKNFEIPEEVNRFVTERAQKMEDSREGTIGQHLYKTYSGSSQD